MDSASSLAGWSVWFSSRMRTSTDAGCSEADSVRTPMTVAIMCSGRFSEAGGAVMLTGIGRGWYS